MDTSELLNYISMLVKSSLFFDNIDCSIILIQAAFLNFSLGYGAWLLVSYQAVVTVQMWTEWKAFNAFTSSSYFVAHQVMLKFIPSCSLTSACDPFRRFY